MCIHVISDIKDTVEELIELSRYCWSLYSRLSLADCETTQKRCWRKQKRL